MWGDKDNDAWQAKSGHYGKPGVGMVVWEVLAMESTSDKGVKCG
jgi:hypothetical protein